MDIFAIVIFSLPALRRGSPVFCYYPTTDGKLIEYDFDACSFHEKSKYQDVCIMHSPQFGNMLILDGDPSNYACAQVQIVLTTS